MIVPGSILYVTSLWAIKVSLVIFYKIIAAPASRLQIVYNVAIGLLLASWATIFFHIIFQCYPHDKRWSMDPNYQCDPRDAEINYWLTILLNIGSDVATIGLPISMVLKLQMKLKQKLGVAAIFALGFFVIIASIGGTQIRDNDSDEELFKEDGRLSASGRGASVTPTSDNPGVISVSTTFQVHHGANEEGAMSKERLEQYP
ncbi:hypothetical protein COL922a_009052 [Colletotrichum nupharicola]|nr:hypothetical protein COL922a_009052 [Colletotrichum nupharicola]